MRRQKSLSFKINSLIKFLNGNKSITRIGNARIYYDEPKYFFYGALLKKTIDDQKYEFESFGVDFFSAKIALLRCLVEAIERSSQLLDNKEKIVFYSYKSCDDFIDLKPYLTNSLQKLENKKLGWVKGFCLSENKEVFVSAQLVYLNYQSFYYECLLSPVISTGAAGGFNYEETLLRGIYEVIERDTIMTVYLGKIKIPKIDLRKIGSSKIDKIINICQRYLLDVCVFKATHDLGVPVFLSAIIDQTDHLPQLTFGAKSDFNEETAIIGSIREALMTRISHRKLFYEHKLFNLPNNRLSNQQKRALFWLRKDIINKHKFLLTQKPIPYKIKTNYLNNHDSINKIILLLEKKKLKIYHVNLTQRSLSKMGIFCLKIIIPGLQPLYLDEKERFIDLNRLTAVTKHFNQPLVKINKNIHPYL